MIGKLLFTPRSIGVFPRYDEEANWMARWSVTEYEKELEKSSPYIFIRFEMVERRSRQLENVVTILCKHGVCVTWEWMLKDDE